MSDPIIITHSTRFMFVVEEKQKGERIDLFLELKLNDQESVYSRSFIHKFWDYVTLNEKNVKKSYKVKSGDVILFAPPPPKQLELKPEQIDLDIVFEDESILIINKPAGMVVHPSKGHQTNTIVHGILDKLDFRNSINGIIRPGIVHRLDKDTSGLLIVAKNNQSMMKLSTMFKNREIQKTYMALTIGNFVKKSDTVNKPLKRHPKYRKKFTVHPDGKHSITNYSVIDEVDGYSLLKVQLITGRTHQIRVHLSSIGHPIVGDKVYSKKSNKTCPEYLLLCAKELEFIHPVTQKKITFSIEIPDFFNDFLLNLGFQR